MSVQEILEAGDVQLFNKAVRDDAISLGLAQKTTEKKSRRRDPDSDDDYTDSDMSDDGRGSSNGPSENEDGDEDGRESDGETTASNDNGDDKEKKDSNATEDGSDSDHEEEDNGRSPSKRRASPVTNEYEQKRQANIMRNQRMLDEILKGNENAEDVVARAMRGTEGENVNVSVILREKPETYEYSAPPEPA